MTRPPSFSSENYPLHCRIRAGIARMSPTKAILVRGGVGSAWYTTHRVKSAQPCLVLGITRHFTAYRLADHAWKTNASKPAIAHAERTNWAGGTCGNWDSQHRICLDNKLLKERLLATLRTPTRYPSHVCPLSIATHLK